MSEGDEKPKPQITRHPAPFTPLRISGYSHSSGPRFDINVFRAVARRCEDFAPIATPVEWIQCVANLERARAGDIPDQCAAEVAETIKAIEEARRVHLGQPKQVAPPSLAKAKSDCRNWLAGLMRESERALKPKDNYYDDAKHLFPGLSRRGFDAAWGAAISETNRNDWAKPGAKPQKINRK